mgnify:CR=1 FL=1
MTKTAIKRAFRKLDSTEQADVLKDLAATLAEALSEEDRILVGRARRIQRFLSQNTFVAKVFTGIEGSFVPLVDTIAAFEALADGKYDHLPEQAFFMCGGLDDVERRAAELTASVGK